MNGTHHSLVHHSFIEIVKVFACDEFYSQQRTKKKKFSNLALTANSLNTDVFQILFDINQPFTQSVFPDLFWSYMLFVQQSPFRMPFILQKNETTLKHEENQIRIPDAHSISFRFNSFHFRFILFFLEIVVVDYLFKDWTIPMCTNVTAAEYMHVFFVFFFYFFYQYHLLHWKAMLNAWRR